MFLGTHRPRLDEKGRIFLPARFRDELAEGVVITKGQERCLYGWPPAEFQRVAAAFSQASMTARAVREFGRMLYSSGSLEKPDKQGRITLPPALRNYAGLTRDCAVVGNNSRLEIWDETAWDTWVVEHESDFSDIAEEVLPGVL